MKMKLIGFICLVSVLMLALVSLHGAQETGQKSSRQISVHANLVAIGVAFWVQRATANPLKRLSLPRGPRRARPSFGTRRSGPATVRQPFPKDDCSCSIATVDWLA